MKSLRFTWKEIGDRVEIDSKEFFRLMRWLKRNFINIEVLSCTGKKPRF
jgi:hypothetical protein